jgi:hypothetical protein
MEKRAPTSSRRTPAQWAEIVKASNATHLPLGLFCAEAGVPLSGLYVWRSKLNSSAKAQPRGFTAIKPRLAPASPDTASAIEICLANGRTVRVKGGQVDAQVLQTVIRVAEAGGLC